MVQQTTCDGLAQPNPSRTRAQSSKEFLMCSPAICPICRKVTYTGCGRHVSAVMANVPPANQCKCR